MTHEELIRDLDRYIDGELSDAVRRDVEDHLASCASCREELRRMGSLLDHAAILRDRPLSPARDLWPDIRRGLNPAPSRRPFRHPVWGLRLLRHPAIGWAMAAIGLLAVLWAVGRMLPGVERHGLADGVFDTPADGGLGHDAGSRPDPRPGGLPREGSYLEAELSVLEAECGASLRLVAQAVEAAPQAGREAGWDVFEQNLGVLDTAIAESRRALEDDPTNTGLQRALLIAYQRQLDLLRWAQRIMGQV